MKIGVISDSHDNIPFVQKAVRYFNETEPVDAVIHAGDYVAPFVVKELTALKPDFYGVFGNNDGERAGINSIMPQIAKPPLHITLDGKRFVVVHDIGTLPEADRREADVVIYGHSHKVAVESTDGKLTVNPGELGGWLTGSSTLAVIELQTMTAKIIQLR